MTFVFFVDFCFLIDISLRSVVLLVVRENQPRLQNGRNLL